MTAAKRRANILPAEDRRDRSETFDPDLGPAEVADDRNRPPHFFGDPAQLPDALFLLVPGAVREIQPGNIDTGLQHVRENFVVIRDRTQSRHDFGSSQCHHYLPVSNGRLPMMR